MQKLAVVLVSLLWAGIWWNVADMFANPRPPLMSLTITRNGGEIEAKLNAKTYYLTITDDGDELLFKHGEYDEFVRVAVREALRRER